MGSELSRVKRLLRARDWASVVQGVELVRAAGEPAWVDALLEGVTYNPQRHLRYLAQWRKRSTRKVWAGLEYTGALAGNAAEQPYRDVAALRLISGGQGARAAALRAEITHLALLIEPNVGTLPLDGLALPHLTSLEIEAEIERIDTFTFDGWDLPALTDLRVELSWGSEIPSLAGLGGAPSLRRAHLRAERILDASGLPPLEALEIEGIDSLDALPTTLRSLTLRRCPRWPEAARTPAALARFPALERVEVDNKPFVTV